ncbi:MAG: choice-of-anchor D domain-containing protein [Ignavibacteriae bacterium]|nr:choice-of-anchor D domain-containing protein [Ignavibacteriota bacterium]
MNRKLLNWTLLTALVCAFFGDVIAQPSVKINYVDALGYPNIKAYYTYKDASGKEIRPNDYTWKPQDIIINENGKNRAHNPGSPFCADPNQKAFSAILVFDVSKSMRSDMFGVPNPPPGQGKWEVAFRGMEHFIAALDPAITECAIIEFGQLAGKKIWFTNNKDSLFEIVTKEPNFGLTTNYNSAFLRNKAQYPDGTVYEDPTNSPLYIAQFAKYKPVVIFLTDGKHNPSNYLGDDIPFKVGEAFNLAKSRNVYVFVIKIGNEQLDGSSDASLSMMASVEGNSSDNYAKDITDPNALVGFYDKVLQICGQVGFPAPCYTEWTSECDPSGPRTLDLTFPNHSNLTASTTFSVPGNLKPYLEITPSTINFRNIKPPAMDSVQVRIKAKNNFVKFNMPNGYVSSDPRYTISDWGGLGPGTMLEKDTTRFIKVKYTPTDSWCSSAVINFDDIIASSACNGNIQVTGMLDQFVEDVNMGDATVGVEKKQYVIDVFCNRSCKPVTVTALDIKTGDAAMFGHSGITLPKTLIPQECISDTFSFNPTVQGPKSSKINVTLDTGAGNQTLISNITGNAIGQPGITSVNPLNLPNTNCIGSTRDSIIYVKNTGPIPLSITLDELVGVNADEFEYIPKPIPGTINANDSIMVTIRFKPKNSGTKQCSLHIQSNAAGNTDYYIQINGIADSINYEPEKTIDLGIVCLGTPMDTIINLANVGSKLLHIEPNTVPSEFTFTEAFWDVPDSTTTPVRVTFTPSKDGPINFDVIFTEDLCNIQKTVHFTGTVHDPKVTTTTITVNSTVGTQTDTIITIINASTTVPLHVDSIVFDDVQFEYRSSVPSLPRDIAPGDSIKVTIRYKPDTSKVVNTFLRMKGMPCKDVLITLIGNPSQATVDIVIDTTHTGYIGETKQFPVYLRNANMFAESKTQSINFDVSFDASLLKYTGTQYQQNTAGGITTLQLKNISVLPINIDQNPVTIDLLVTDGTVTSTPLSITNAKSDKVNVAFNQLDGLFRLITASATLTTKSYEEFPGREFQLEIWQINGKNLSDFHESITTEVRCNFTVLEALAGYDSNKIVNGERVITLKDIPIDKNPGERLLKSFKFRPMLGNSDTTYIVLQNSRSAKGKINFDSIDGKLTLKGICTDPDGTKRLFEPGTAASLEAINPNPANGITEVKYILSEPGTTRIWLSNVLGDKIMELADEYMNKGDKTLSFDANNLPDGVYFIIMQTPTQLFKKRFNIIK